MIMAQNATKGKDEQIDLLNDTLDVGGDEDVEIYNNDQELD